MEAQIILRTKTSAAPNLLNLMAVIRVHRYTGSNRRPVRLRSNQLNQQPGIFGRRLITKQRRKVIQIIDDNVDPSSIEEVAKGNSPAASRLSKCGTGLR